MSPVQLLIAFSHGDFHPLTNGLPHTWYREQVKCFLNCRPVFLGHQDGFVSLTRDANWLVGLGGLVNQPIKVAARLSCRDSRHDAPLACSNFHQCTTMSTYVKTNALHNANNKRRPDRGVRWRPQAGTNLIDLLSGWTFTTPGI